MTGARTTDPFVGRETELATLRACLGDVERGRGRLVLVSGEAGIGKTRLADEFARDGVASPGRVLWGRCWEGEGAPALLPWMQIVRGALAGRDIADVRRELAHHATHLARLVPALDGKPHPTDPEPPGDPVQERFRVFDAIVTLLRNAAGHGPLVVIVDDVHWADVLSLRVLHFVARELRDLGVLVVATCRDTELPGDPARAGVLAAVAREGTPLALGGLAHDDVARLIAEATGAPPAPELVAAVHERTDGNPFFVNEVLRALDGAHPTALPRGAHSVIGRRLDRLSPAARGLLRAAAVQGRTFSPSTLRAVAGVDDTLVLAVLDEGVEQDLLVRAAPQHDEARFRHALVCEALYAELSSAERAALHRRTAEVIAARAGDPTPHLAELAHHFLQAAVLGDDGRAFTYAERAAERCAEQLAFEDAAVHYEHALALVRSAPAVADPGEREVRLLVALGDVLQRAGERPRARDVFRRAIDLARTLERNDLFTLAAFGYLGRYEIISQRDDELLRVLREALERVPATDERARARLLARLAVATAFVDRARAGELSVDALALAERLGDPTTRIEALGARWLALWGPDDADERLALASRQQALAERHANDEAALSARVCLLYGHLERGDRVAADREIAAYARAAADLRQPFYLWQAASHAAMVALMDGRIADAERFVTEAAALGDRSGSGNAPLRNAVHLYLLRRAQGRLAEIEPAFAAVAAHSPTFPAFRAALAALYAELGRLDDVYTHFEPLAADLTAIPRDGFWPPTVVNLATVCHALGDTERAAMLADLLAPFAERVVVVSFNHGCEGAYAHALGLLAATCGDLASAERFFESARHIEAGLGARLLVAHTDLAWGDAILELGGPGDRTRGRALVERARSAYAQLGLAHFAARAAARPTELPAATPSPAADPTSSPSVFRRTGDFWTLAYQGAPVRLTDSKGLGYLGRLVAEPGREFHVIDLAGAVRMRESDADAVPDEQARSAYRRHLDTLRAELEEAEARHDLGRATRLREELDRLAEELAGSYGLFGAAAQRRDMAERVRKAVTNAIRRDLRRIAAVHAELGRHLEGAVRTGAFCRYTPERPTRWDV